jgi:simple sugar transport system permease protein
MGQDLALPVLSIAAAVALFGVFAAVAAGSSPPEVPARRDPRSAP